MPTGAETDEPDLWELQRHFIVRLTTLGGFLNLLTVIGGEG